MAGAIHTNVLKLSHADVVTLGSAVEDRFIEVLDLHLRVKKVAIVPPKELDADMRRWREMRIRHKKGDYRNTSDEFKSTTRIADWTLRLKCDLCGKVYVPQQWVEP